MNCIISFLALFFVVVGIASVVRYIVWKITDGVKNAYHYLVLLQDCNAEIMLRAAVERNKFDTDDRRIFAVDMGVDKQTLDALQLFLQDHPQTVLCKPEQLKDLL